MTDQELEQRLRTAVEHAAPDPLDRILAACGDRPPKNAPSVFRPAPRRRRFPLAAAAALVVLCCGVWGFHGWRAAHTVDATVMLDVNPSLSMDLNARERVLSVTPLNSDAERILDDMDLTGVILDVAMNALIGSMLRNGYLDELQNTVLISVENGDDARSAQLRRHITDAVGGLFQNGTLEAAVLTQTVSQNAALAALAEQYGVSIGKAALIQEVAAQDATLTFAALAPLSVTEIALLSQSRQLNPETVTQTGSASAKAYLSPEEAQAAALAHAGVAAGDAARWETELDSEEGVMVYEVEFHAGGTEYDYDVDARTGAVVKVSRKSDGTGASPAPASPAPSPAAPPSASSAAPIGRDAAVSTALRHAGVSAAQIFDLEAELDEDDGVTLYEISFQAEDTEYEYEIRASDGAVLKADQERDD